MTSRSNSFTGKGFLFLVILSLYCLQPAIAQDEKGMVLIAVSPENAIIRLDTSLFKQLKSHTTLDTGIYIIKSWAPGRLLAQDTIKVTNLKPLLYRKKLEMTSEYKRYRNQRVLYKFQKSGLYIPGIITVISGFYYYNQYSKHSDNIDKYKDQALASKEIYDNQKDPEDVEYYRADYNNKYNKYVGEMDKVNTIRKQAYIVLPLEIIATGALFYLSKIVSRPIFKETPLLSEVSINYDFYSTTKGLKMNYTLKF